MNEKELINELKQTMKRIALDILSEEDKKSERDKKGENYVVSSFNGKGKSIGHVDLSGKVFYLKEKGLFHSLANRMWMSSHNFSPGETSLQVLPRFYEKNTLIKVLINNKKYEEIVKKHFESFKTIFRIKNIEYFFYDELISNKNS